MIQNPYIIRKIKKLASLGYPFNATFELTSRCNIFCKYCYIDNSVEELSTAEVRTALDKLDQSGICTLLITGGEPFIRNDILDILSYTFRKNFFEVYILSNGTLLDKEHISFLKANSKSINLFRVSLFSHIPEVHDSFVGVPGSFEKSLKNAKMLLSAGVRTGILINTISQNVQSIETSSNYFQSLGFKVQVAKSKMLITDKIRDEFSETITEDFYSAYYRNICKEEIVELKCQMESDLHINKDSQRLCDGLFGLISIRSDGSITPCLTFRNLSVGNIVSDNRTLQEIYHSSEIYHLLNNLKRSDIPKCRECKFKNVCNICPGIMHSETGSFSEPSPMFCNMVKALDKVIIPEIQ